MRPSKLLFDEIVAKIQAIYEINEAKSITFLLFEQFTGFTKADILSNKMLAQNYDFEPLIERVLNHEPVQYIVGNTYFYGNKFVVKNGITLIPRPETEELVQLAINALKTMEKPMSKLSVLDIGTGSGCIAISIAKALDYVEVTAFDISKQAIHWADINSQLNNTFVKFEVQNILDWEHINCEKFDLIISNPPYLTQAEKLEMNKNVLDFEPHLALFVEDTDPLIFYRNIALFAQRKLTDNGILMVEINENFGSETAECFTMAGFKSPEVKKDLNNKNRIVTAKK
jgi:release factor glutamine methyltransferase